MLGQAVADLSPRAREVLSHLESKCRARQRRWRQQGEEEQGDAEEKKDEGNAATTKTTTLVLLGDVLHVLADKLASLVVRRQPLPRLSQLQLHTLGNDDAIFRDLVVLNISQQISSRQFLEMQRPAVLWGALLKSLVSLNSSSLVFTSPSQFESLLAGALDGDGDDDADADADANLDSDAVSDCVRFLEQSPHPHRSFFATLFLLFAVILHDDDDDDAHAAPQDNARPFLETMSEILLPQDGAGDADEVLRPLRLVVMARLAVACLRSELMRNLQEKLGRAVAMQETLLSEYTAPDFISGVAQLCARLHIPLPKPRRSNTTPSSSSRSTATSTATNNRPLRSNSLPGSVAASSSDRLRLHVFTTLPSTTSTASSAPWRRHLRQARESMPPPLSEESLRELFQQCLVGEGGKGDDDGSELLADSATLLRYLRRRDPGSIGQPGKLAVVLHRTGQRRVAWAHLCDLVSRANHLSDREAQEHDYGPGGDGEEADQGDGFEFEIEEELEMERAEQRWAMDGHDKYDGALENKRYCRAEGEEEQGRGLLEEEAWHDEQKAVEASGGGDSGYADDFHEAAVVMSGVVEQQSQKVESAVKSVTTRPQLSVPSSTSTQPDTDAQGDVAVKSSASETQRQQLSVPQPALSPLAANAPKQSQGEESHSPIDVYAAESGASGPAPAQATTTPLSHESVSVASSGVFHSVDLGHASHSVAAQPAPAPSPAPAVAVSIDISSSSSLTQQPSTAVGDERRQVIASPAATTTATSTNTTTVAAPLPSQSHDPRQAQTSGSTMTEFEPRQRTDGTGLSRRLRGDIHQALKAAGARSISPERAAGTRRAEQREREEKAVADTAALRAALLRANTRRGKNASSPSPSSPRAAATSGISYVSRAKVMHSSGIERLSSRGLWVARFLELALDRDGRPQLTVYAHSVTSAWGSLPCDSRGLIQLGNVSSVTIDSSASAKGRQFSLHLHSTEAPPEGLVGPHDAAILGKAQPQVWVFRCSAPEERMVWVRVIEAAREHHESGL